jgi:gamma-glutamylcyclotransferase (GGCT)/AIG2-like uncharacterized protein YtfP
MNKLFVYGIFLGERARRHYGMSSPEYDTVEDYATIGNTIVWAVEERGYTLSGLVVDVDPSYWAKIDSLEHGYKRIIVTTTHGIKTFMYVGG